MTPGKPPSGLALLLGRAMVAVAAAEFVVHMHNDTTDIEVIDRHRVPTDSLAELVNIMGGRGADMRLLAGERARIIRGVHIEKLPPASNPPNDSTRR